MNKEQLKTILEEGDDRQCATFFQGATESQRRALAPMCLAWFRKVDHNDFIETGSGSFRQNSLLGVAATAAFATGSLSELKKLGWRGRPDDSLTYEIVLDRRPDWLDAWALELLTEDYFWSNWSMVRRLMAGGLIERPDHPNYILAMISGIVGTGRSHGEDKTVEQALREDPSLFEDELWLLFSYEGAGENSLANWDRFSRSRTWSDALLALMKSGDLPRERLLACSLDALELDFNHYRAKWFASFHDALKPSVEERGKFAERYLRLLGVSSPNIVSWAFKKVDLLSKGKQTFIDAGTLVAGLRPVLEARQKGIVKKALKLLAKSAKQSPNVAPDVANAALHALAHEEADVQSAALDVIEAFGEPDDHAFAARLAEFTEVVVPSERSRLGRWLVPDGEQTASARSSDESDDAATFDPKQLVGIDPQLLDLYGVNALVENLQQDQIDISAATFDGTEIPRLDSEQQIMPIADLDELIEVCSRVIEDDSLVDDAERAFDGISRLCDQKPGDFGQLSGPLLQRVTKGLKKNMLPFAGIGADDDLCGLVYAWCAGIVLEGKEINRGGDGNVEFEIEGETHGFFSANKKKALGFLSQRVLAIARRVADGNAAPLLSAPTHAGGWIDPCVFVRRVNASSGVGPDVTDVCQAILRLAPEGRASALDQLDATTKEWGLAIRYALGDDNVSVGKTPALWIAAARCRSPWFDDEQVAQAFPDQGPDAGRAASYAYKCHTRDSSHTDLFLSSRPAPGRLRDVNCVTVTFHTMRKVGAGLRFELGGGGGKTVGSIRWTASIWPQARESFFAVGASEIADNLDWWEAQWQNKAWLEPLLDSSTPLREMGLLLLTLGLAAKDPGEYGLATDAAICAIEDGRLGADNLGPVLAKLLPTGKIKPARWQKRFADVARISPVHTAVVQQALQRCFTTNPNTMPRDFAKLFDLLKELSIDLGQNISHESCRTFLASIKGSGKAAKVAKSLLALEEDDPAESKKIIQLAINQRLCALPGSDFARGDFG